MKKFIPFILTIALIGCSIIFANAEATNSVYTTDHFSFELSSEWQISKNDYWNYICTDNTGTKFQLLIREELLNFSDSGRSTFYDAISSSLKEKFPEGFEEKNIEVDNEQSLFMRYYASVDDIPVTNFCAVYMVNSYCITAAIRCANGNGLEERFLDFLNTVHYRFEKHPSIYSFGDKHVQIIGYEVVNQNNAECLVVEFRWWHSSDEPTAFAYSLSSEAYQNGVQLTPYILLGKNSGTTTKIEKNVGFRCYEVYLLRDNSSDIKLIIDSFFDISNKYKDIAITIQIQ